MKENGGASVSSSAYVGIPPTINAPVVGQPVGQPVQVTARVVQQVGESNPSATK
jgi:hypothetical protein